MDLNQNHGGWWPFRHKQLGTAVPTLSCRMTAAQALALYTLGFSDLRCSRSTPAGRGEERGLHRSRLWATQRKPEIHGPKGLGGICP